MEVLNPINETNITSMKNMVDLALGSPEVGIVNFNVLHSLLHAILNKLQMDEAVVDLPNEEAKSQDSKTKIASISISNIPYHGLQERIKILELQISDLNSLPSNKDILNSVLHPEKKDNSDTDSQKRMSELWQTLSIRKKVNTNEEGIDRLSSMIDAILEEMKQLKSDNDDLKRQLENLAGLKDVGNRVDGLQNDLANLLAQINDLKDKLSQYPSPDALKNVVTWEGLEKALKGIKDDMEELKKPVERIVVNMATEDEHVSKAYEAFLEWIDGGCNLKLNLPVEHVVCEVNRLIELGEITPNVKDEDEVMFNLKIPLKDTETGLKSEKIRTLNWKLVPKSKDLKPRVSHAEELELNVPLTKWQLLQAGLINIPDNEAIEGIDYFIIDIPIKNEQFCKSAVVTTSEMVVQPEPANNLETPMSRPISQSSSNGPSEVCAEMLEKLGTLTTAHDLLDKRVVVLEEEMPNKADKKDLENLKIPDDLLKTIAQLKAQIDALMSSKNREVPNIVAPDAEALTRIRNILNSLQDKMNAVNDTLEKLSRDNKDLLNQIEELFGITKDHEHRKADIGYVDGLVRTKADKSLLDTKVNFTLFDETTGNLHSLIDDVLKKLLSAEEELRNLLKALASDLEGKVDKDDLNALKEWIEKRLRALADKLKNIRGTAFSEDDAAGLRKQLLQHFHCISCDRPVDVLTHGVSYVNGFPEAKGLPPSKSFKPFTSYEMDAMRQQSKNNKNMYVQNHTKRYGSDIIDVYQTPRPCGGSHTTTYLQKKMVRIGNMNNSFIEDDGHSRVREELDLQGADGHIYKGRFDRSQTTIMNNSNNYNEQLNSDKLPPVTSTQRSQTNINNSYTPRGAFVTSRPKSAVRITPRPILSAGHSRPTSARVTVPDTESRPTSPVLNLEQSLTDVDELQIPMISEDQIINNEVINTSDSFNIEVVSHSENEPQSTDEAVLL